MKRALLLVCVFSVAGLAVAQQTSQADVFGGYSYLRINPSGVNANGWEAALTGNFSDTFGLTADFSGHYAQGGHVYTYVFGPQLAAHRDNLRPFGHLLFGGNSIGGGDFGNTSYALLLGGGLDLKLTTPISIRLGQADYVRTHHFEQGQNNFRFSAGIVLNLGEK
jgi:hypothetical protein